MISFKSVQWQTFSVTIIVLLHNGEKMSHIYWVQLLFIHRQLHDPLCFAFLWRGRAGNMNAWEALFCKTQNLDKSGPCGVNRLSVKQEVTLL